MDFECFSSQAACCWLSVASSRGCSQLLQPSHARPLPPCPCRERVSMCLSQIPAWQLKPADRLIAAQRPVTQSHGCPPGQGSFFIPGCQRRRKAVTHFEGCQQVACLKKQALKKYAGLGEMFCCLSLPKLSLWLLSCWFGEFVKRKQDQGSPE